MNEKGLGLIPILLIAVVVVALAPALFMIFFPAAGLLLKIIMAFLIFSTIRQYLGNGVISLIVSAILIYFIVIKWAPVAASIYVVIFLLMAVNFFSVLFWGIATNMPKNH